MIPKTSTPIKSPQFPFEIIIPAILIILVAIVLAVYLIRKRKTTQAKSS
jgi:hypothetical protein